MLLVLTHLFRMKGNPVYIEDAVDFLSFKCRYGAPSEIRRMLSVALNNEMISRKENEVFAEFLFDKQILPHNLTYALNNSARFTEDIEPMH